MDPHVHGASLYSHQHSPFIARAPAVYLHVSTLMRALRVYDVFNHTCITSLFHLFYHFCLPYVRILSKSVPPPLTLPCYCVFLLFPSIPSTPVCRAEARRLRCPVVWPRARRFLRSTSGRHSRPWGITHTTAASSAGLLLAPPTSSTSNNSCTCSNSTAWTTSSSMTSCREVILASGTTMRDCIITIADACVMKIRMLMV